MSIPMQVNFALVVPKRLNKRQKPASLLKGVGGSNGMDETYVAALGNGVKGGKCSQAVAKCLFSLNVGFHHARSPHISVPIPMGKPPTGEPCAGEPHARFGGRGGATLPDPYHHKISQIKPDFRLVDAIPII